MSCARCQADEVTDLATQAPFRVRRMRVRHPDPARRLQRRRQTAGWWCPSCEQSYDAWNRRNASDIMVAAFAGAVVLLTLGVGLPLLGVNILVAATAAVAGFGTIVGIHRLTRRRRRRQYLGTGLPRAYLLAKT